MKRSEKNWRPFVRQCFLWEESVLGILIRGTSKGVERFGSDLQE
jgi:hypothetical protein